MMPQLDPTELEVMKHNFTAVPEQMGASLQRCAYSPNIKERKDESCALFSSNQKMIAQAEHIPVHLGAMPKALEKAVKEINFSPKDQILLNDPYSGGTHLPDITLIKPVFKDETHLGFVVNRAHHADIGGKTPGSMPGKSETLEEEGLIFSPQHIVKNGEENEKVLKKFKEKTRAPKERIGDLRAQIGANEKGAEEFKKIVEKFGLEKYGKFVEDIIKYSEKRTKKIISDLPDVELKSEDMMEWEEEVKLRTKIMIESESIKYDFKGTDNQVQGNINAPEPVTHSAVYYTLRCLLPDDIPVNEGCYNQVDIEIPDGSVLNPNPPAAVSSGNVETSQRVVELIFRALSKILPEKIPAESQGTMNNLIIGSEDFTYYETIGGGAGASKGKEGESAVHVHMTNTKNTPIESLENNYPLRVTSYKIRKGSGGSGEHSGGDGIIREIKVLNDAKISIQSERRRIPPKGMKGGSEGKVGKNIKINENEEQELESKITLKLKKGEKIRIETPGGGGWGKVRKI